MHESLRSLTCDCLWYRYELSHVVRTHMGASDASYTCVYQQEDDDGATGVHVWTSEAYTLLMIGVLNSLPSRSSDFQESLRFYWCAAGVYLSKDLMAIAGHALKANITTLAPLVLPVSEQLLFFINLVARKVRLLSLSHRRGPVLSPAIAARGQAACRAGILHAAYMQAIARRSRDFQEACERLLMQ